MNALGLALTILSAAPVEVVLEQRVEVSPGDTLILKGGAFSVRYEGNLSKTPCATPTNCGSGYMPRAQFTVLECGGKAPKDCPFEARHMGNTSKGYQVLQVAIISRAATAAVTAAVCRKLTGESERDGCFASLSMRDTERDGAVCEGITGSNTTAREECFVRVAARRDDDTLCLKVATPDKRNRCLGTAMWKTKDVRTCEGILETTHPFQLHNFNTRAGCVTGVIDVVRRNLPTPPEVCTTLKDQTTREFCVAFANPAGGPQSVCDGIAATNALARAHCVARSLTNKPVTEAQCRQISDILLYRQCCTRVTGGCSTPNP